MGGSTVSLEAEAKRLLAVWLDTPKLRFPARADDGADMVVEHEHGRLVVEFKATSDTAAVGAAIAHVKTYARRIHRNAVPVVAVPFMGEVGKRLCDEAGVSWFDLSGNAHIVAPGLRILIAGKPNKFLRPGRPSSVFAPKSARIARRLLIEPERRFRQQELARVTGLDDGFTSRIVRRLEEDALIARAEDGTVSVKNPHLLLDAWCEAYSFDKHTVMRGHVSTRSSEMLVASLGKSFEEKKLRHAATGLAAAWLLTKFSAFRLVTFFVAEPPEDALLAAIGFREQPRGSNVWLAIPDDPGVFDGSATINKISVVHPVQAYVDLMAHPERAKDAAKELRSRCLRWGGDE
jgi:Transcriptional regulator, AbiEi antitoxin, Type IV TA system